VGVGCTLTYVGSPKERGGWKRCMGGEYYPRQSFF